MEIIIYKNEELFKMKKEWDLLFDSKNHLGFLEFEWQKKNLKKYRLTYLNKKLNNLVYLVCKEGNDILAIVPVLIRNKKGYLSGYGIGVDYTDMLSKKDFKISYLNEIVGLLKSKFSIKTLYLHNIKSTSVFYEYATNYNYDFLVKQNLSVGISLPQNYEDYYKTLSKSVKQNIRTANNRLEKDDKYSEIKIYKNTSIDEKLIMELKKIYYTRKKEKYKSFNINASIYNLIFSNKYEHIFDTMKNGKGNFLALIEIEKEIAAYCYGVISGSEINIIQVSTNCNYYKYSPGMILLTRVIENLIETKTFRRLDLTLGAEKYKYDLGGNEEIIYSYTLDLEDRNFENH